MTQNGPSKWTSIGRAGAIGFEVAGSVVGGMLLGDYLDRHLGSGPWFTVGLVFAGMVFGMVRVIREFGGSDHEDGEGGSSEGKSDPIDIAGGTRRR